MLRTHLTVRTHHRLSVSFALSCALLSLSACGGLTHKMDNQALAEVKKAAVVGFTVDEPAAAGLGMKVGSGKVGAVRGGSPIAKEGEEANQMLSSLQSDLARGKHWTVLTTAQMVSRPGYQSAYERTMKGFQNKFLPSAGHNRFLVPQVMDFDSIRILGQTGRDQLLNDLGVDAIVVAHVNVELKGTTFGGIGPRHPQANVGMSVYKRGQEAPIWFEGQVLGEEAQESVGSTGFIDEQLLAELALKSSQSAFQKLSVASQ